MSGSLTRAGGVAPTAGPSASETATFWSQAAAVVRTRSWAVAVYTATVTWTAGLFAVVRDRHAEFRFARYDLGNMVQAVWSTAHGRPLEMTDWDGEQVNRLGGHVDPVLVALAPLWTVWPSPLSLATVQIAAVALGALPIFWLARRHSGSERAAALLAFAYLAYPWIAWTAADPIHPVTLAIPLFLFAVWFLDGDRLLPFAICTVGVLLTQELMGVIVAALGIWYLLARGRRAGLVIAAAGVSWTLLALYVVIPAFSGGASAFYGAFDDVGGSPQGILGTAFTDPAAIWSAVTESDDLVYLFLIAVPLAGAFVLAPALAAVALPQLAANLLAGISGPNNPREHYIAAIVPFLFAASAIGLRRLSPTRRMRAASLVLTVSVAGSIAVGPWPGTVLGAAAWSPLPTTSEYVRSLHEAVSLVPRGAPVSSTNRVGSHLAERRYYYSVPVVGSAEWIVVETADTWVPGAISGEADPEALRLFVDRIRRSSEWELVFERSGVLVFERVRS